MTLKPKNLIDLFSFQMAVRFQKKSYHKNYSIFKKRDIEAKTLTIIDSCIKQDTMTATALHFIRHRMTIMLLRSKHF